MSNTRSSLYDENKDFYSKKHNVLILIPSSASVKSDFENTKSTFYNAKVENVLKK